jgi:cellulose synthase/poly-beta-1,6-N-acetylglucosamine synthase-like glycosyltransferase
MELGLRLHIAGVGITFASQATVTQQGLVDLRRLVRQRTRWAQGNLQCVRYVPRLVASRRITNSALVEMLYYLLAPWFNAAGSVAIVAIYGFGVWGLLPGHDPMPYAQSWAELGGATLIWAGAALLPGVVWAIAHRLMLRDERMSRMLLAALAFPVFLLLGLVATVRAIGRQLTRRQAWAKTERLAEEPVQRSSARPADLHRGGAGPKRPPRRRARARQKVRARRRAHPPNRRRPART